MHTMDFQTEQLLFEAFHHILRIFGSIEPLSKTTFPFLYIIIFQRWQSLESLSSTPGEHRHMSPLTFLYRIQCSTTFI